MIEYACDDFNVGDLASCNLRSGPLSDCLARHGVGNLTVESVALDGWNYDTPLVELEDE